VRIFFERMNRMNRMNRMYGMIILTWLVIARG